MSNYCPHKNRAPCAQCAGIAQGRELERAAVVAWLAVAGVPSNTRPGEVDWTKRVIATVASEIARGEHRKGGE